MYGIERKHISYKEAKKIVRKEKFKFQTVFSKKWKKEFKSLNIPYRPQYKYKNKGWKGWKDFLGDTYIGDQWARNK